jgi:hypothetical protein
MLMLALLLAQTAAADDTVVTIRPAGANSFEIEVTGSAGPQALSARFSAAVDEACKATGFESFDGTIVASAYKDNPQRQTTSQIVHCKPPKRRSR